MNANFDETIRLKVENYRARNPDFNSENRKNQKVNEMWLQIFNVITLLTVYSFANLLKFESKQNSSVYIIEEKTEINEDSIQELY